MKILLICDDYQHPGQIPIDGVALLEQRGFQFDIITNANDFSESSLAQYPAVLLCKCDEVSQTERTPWKTEDVQRTFIDYVEGGGGLLAVHSAVVSGKNTEALDKLLGCRFLKHPLAGPVTVQPVKPHPVTEGVGMFRETDEHYRLEILADDINILLASYSPPQGEESKYQKDWYHNSPAAICAAGFTRTQGRGRVCVLTPGHNLAVWLNAQFQQLLENALNWAGGESGG